MTHNYNLYYFINKFNIDELLTLNSNVNIVYRNYNKINLDPIIKNLSYFCKKIERKLFISNNLNLALKYNLDGLYIPAFNKSLKFRNFSSKTNFKLIGSAHNLKEIKIKENQGCDEIFISPIFFNAKNKYHLDIIKFNNLSLNSKLKINALGGINNKNLKRLKLTKSVGFGGISFFNNQ